MADNMWEFVQGNNARAVDLLSRNHSLSNFIVKLCYGFDSYCEDHGLNKFTAQIGNAIISKDGIIQAPIEGGV